MKKLSVMGLAVMSALGFSVATVLPYTLAIGFLLEGLGVTVITKLISAIITVAIFVLGAGINPLIA